jgi:DNA-binding XRE family transcriptional regulator
MVIGRRGLYPALLPGASFGGSVLDNEIKNCVTLVCEHLPVLREILNLKQAEVAGICGTSRQQIIKFEHQEAKLTKSILITLVSYFSLRPKTAQFLSTQGLYKNKFVQDIGFNDQIIAYVIENGINGTREK